VLSGDLDHFAVSRQLRRVPPFNADADQTTASMRRVESLLEETQATLWIEHELAEFERLKHAPAYYPVTARRLPLSARAQDDGPC
jgi:N-acyl homoserine lactone hydrolase